MQIKKCKICQRVCTRITKGMCKKHYAQFSKYGKCLDNNQRTVLDLNEIRIKLNYTEIDTYDSKGNVMDTFIIDTEDIPLLKNHKWRSVIKKRGNKELHYLGTGHTIYFHRILTGSPDTEVDHINRNTLDNRKNNLRIVSKSLNRLNTGLFINNTIGIKGVYKIKDSYYRAELQYCNKKYISPLYKTLEEAVYYRYLLEQHFIPTYNINNRNKMKELINSLNTNVKHNIQYYLTNKLKN